MIVKTEDLQNVCQKILNAIDTNKLSTLTEMLEIKSEEGTLYLNVTNREYYVQCKINVQTGEALHATISANAFLKLISQITTETVELSVENSNCLKVIGNGSYKFPIVFEDDKMLTLPTITMQNITSEFSIDTGILNSIASFNTKQLSLGYISRPIQKLYYIDSKGAVTFTTGACINNFHLSEDVKLLLNSKIVKLFKLFLTDEVEFKMGHFQLTPEIAQTVVEFSNDTVCITAILAYSDELYNAIPIDNIRARATTVFPHGVIFDKSTLTQALNRLSIFATNKSTMNYSIFEFNTDKVTIYDMHKQNHEDISYANENTNITDTYTLIVDTNELKSCIDMYNDQYVNFRFGDHQAISISKDNVTYIIPEVQDTDE